MASPGRSGVDAGTGAGAHRLKSAAPAERRLTPPALHRKKPPDLRRHHDKCFQGIVLDLFRLNGEMARHGAALTSGHGQTKARWQVLGAACEAPTGFAVEELERAVDFIARTEERLRAVDPSEM